MKKFGFILSMCFGLAASAAGTPALTFLSNQSRGLGIQEIVIEDQFSSANMLSHGIAIRFSRSYQPHAYYAETSCTLYFEYSLVGEHIIVSKAGVGGDSIVKALSKDQYPFINANLVSAANALNATAGQVLFYEMQDGQPLGALTEQMAKNFISAFGDRNLNRGKRNLATIMKVCKDWNPRF